MEKCDLVVSNSKFRLLVPIPSDVVENDTRYLTSLVWCFGVINALCDSYFHAVLM